MKKEWSKIIVNIRQKNGESEKREEEGRSIEER